VLGIALAGCSSDSNDDSSSSTTDTTIETNTTSLDDVTVTGNFGEEPTVTFAPAYGGSEDSSRLISTGDGAQVESGQRVSVNYVATDGSTGETLTSTYGSQPQSLIVGGQDLQPIVSEAIIGQPIGSRVLIAIDATQANGYWALLTMDIVDAVTIPTEASGTPVTPRADLPAVTVEDGVPTVAKPEGDPPTELVVQPLIKGDGPEITAGQTVTMQYVGLIWASGEVFDQSWDSGPVDFSVGTGSVIPGFDEGLVGQTLGSRVMLVIPPDKGYGSSGNSQAGISGTDTLVFVVDLLATS
jgi:peptidylprolyl isomerase